MWIQIVITALIIASIPLSSVWLAKGQTRYHKLVAVTLFLTFDLIVFGAFTRLTDSGLGCPDWPGCYGEANPLLAHSAITAAQNAMPSGPVTLPKAWIEMVHRYLAMAVGSLIVAQVVIAWRQRKALKVSPWVPTALLVLVCVQGAFGAWTVTLKLQPVIVTTHLLLGMLLLAVQAWSWASLRLPSASDAVLAPSGDSKRVIIPAALALAVVTVQIALGGWVSTNYAALACQDYPLCHGQLLPVMDAARGFTLWRELGLSADGSYLPFSALVAIHWVHRSFAWLVIVVVGVAVFSAFRVGHLRRLAKYVLAALIAQFFIGVATVLFSWPLLLAVLHNAGAATLVLLLSMLHCRAQRASLDSLP